ncbi:PEPxxWA-CTERM sorting domain-containing protein [Phenylobacterium sp.]|uniref:PEPxxWA-CTERM sorting domain-containing protein n=1 Tax=Phenylobacterium sp. TaxID=1871053 RepID=UPI00286AE5CB|nr:PEPxxWA-CTERM sorting domain-containing protein [Phenylobacterium sp.]
MKNLVFTASLAALAAVAMAPVTASAQAIFSERDVVYNLDTTAGLAATTTQYDNVVTLPAGGGNSIGGAFTFRTGATGVYITTTGGVTTTFPIPPPGTSSETGSILNDGTGGTFNFGYKTSNGPDFTKSWTRSEVQSGHNVLHFSGGGTGFADLGAIFVDNIFITGNWSVLGASAGNHNGLTYDTTNYSLINNFVYNPVHDWTLLTISTGKFPGGSPGIDFYLVGAPVTGGVPEPTTWALMLLGFGGVGAALRSRRRVAASAA